MQARGLFECYGVELEYMIVGRSDLAVRPLSDRVLKAVSGEYASEVELGVLNWSNELVLHVIELKTGSPATTLDGLDLEFQKAVTRINEILLEWDACLMPTAMHPWMDPARETHLWPHEYSPVYETLNRIFGCQGHGWANLQSLHMNLPFADDQEFGRLHAAIRLVLPLLPALAASSPIIEGRVSELVDTRLRVYRDNQRLVPSVTGRVIPEPVFSPDEYQARILRPLYLDISPHDPEGILHYEWLNSRGAIARFDRNTIEIRVLDMQECPAADLAVYALIVEVIRALVEERWTGYSDQRSWAVDPLAEAFEVTVRDGSSAVLDPSFCRVFGLDSNQAQSASRVWRHLFEELAVRLPADLAEIVGRIIARRTLSERILQELNGQPARDGLGPVYRRLVRCLSEGELFCA